MIHYLITGLFVLAAICARLAVTREKKLAGRETREGNRNFVLHLHGMDRDARSRR